VIVSLCSHEILSDDLLKEYLEAANSFNNLQFMSLKEQKYWINEVKDNDRVFLVSFCDLRKGKNVLFFIVKKYKDDLTWKLVTTVVTEKFSFYLYKVMEQSMRLFVKFMFKNNAKFFVFYTHNRNRFILHLTRKILFNPVEDVLNNKMIREFKWMVDDLYKHV